MKYGKNTLMFCTGGTCYMTLELLWRGWSHSSMFLAGGTCFLLLGQLGKTRLSILTKALVGSAVITGVELTTGLLFNRNYTVWDYRRIPYSFLGQICLPYCLLWIPVGLGGMLLYQSLEQSVKKPPQVFPERRSKSRKKTLMPKSGMQICEKRKTPPGCSVHAPGSARCNPG